MSFDSNADRVKVSPVQTVHGSPNIEIVIGESRRIWFTPEEARLVVLGINACLRSQGVS